MGRRVILLVAAALAAAVGAGLVFVYATGTTAANATTSLVSVFKAKAAIEPGTPGSAIPNLVEEAEIPAETVPAGAITNLSDVANLTSLTRVFPGQVLIAAQFGANNNTGGLPIPEGKVAISVGLGDPQRVAGFVHPGSKVDVFVTMSDKTELILHNVTVIAVGPSTIVTSTTTQNGSTKQTDQPLAPLTLALTTEEATKLVHAANSGQPYLGLLPGA